MPTNADIFVPHNGIPTVIHPDRLKSSKISQRRNHFLTGQVAPQAGYIIYRDATVRRASMACPNRRQHHHASSQPLTTIVYPFGWQRAKQCRGWVAPFTAARRAVCGAIRLKASVTSRKQPIPQIARNRTGLAVTARIWIFPNLINIMKNHTPNAGGPCRCCGEGVFCRADG